MIESKPIVGLTPLWDDKLSSRWMLPDYMAALSGVGAIPIVLPFTDDESELTRLLGVCDGLLFTGGHDVSPSFYGERPLADLTETCMARDVMERKLFPLALKACKPIFGICRGIQIINVLLGGTLYQDLPTQYGSESLHQMARPYDRMQHKVTVLPDAPLRRLVGVDEIPVNSRHHQAIRNLASSLEPMAVSEDGLIEAVRKPDEKFCWAVQWHPETSFPFDQASRDLFRAFVAVCAGERIRK